MNVSIVIPSFRHKAYIARAIESCLEQTQKPVDIVILNSDPKMEMYREIRNFLEFPQVKYVQFQPDTLMAHKVNLAVNCLIRGDAVIVLCEDDMLDSTFIQKTATVMDEKEVEIVYTDMKLFGMDNRVVQPLPWCLESFQETTVPFITSLIDVRTWKYLHGYKEFMPMADWDFYWRAFEHGVSYAYISEPLFWCRNHMDQESRHINIEECVAKVREAHRK